MALDPTTLDSSRPRTLDGREYPEHLKPYEPFDAQLLTQLDSLDSPTLNELAVSVGDPRLRSVASRWLASAEWRGLVERDHGADMDSRRTYGLTARGQARLADLD
jgi:DNA-binding MarR family transcriptional regulator